MRSSDLQNFYSLLKVKHYSMLSREDILNLPMSYFREHAIDREPRLSKHLIQEFISVLEFPLEISRILYFIDLNSIEEAIFREGLDDHIGIHWHPKFLTYPLPYIDVHGRGDSVLVVLTAIVEDENDIDWEYTLIRANQKEFQVVLFEGTLLNLTHIDIYDSEDNIIQSEDVNFQVKA
jgi:hypothetical protein